MSGECFYVTHEYDCEACDGKGSVQLVRYPVGDDAKPYWLPCTACSGKGRMREEIKLGVALRRLAELTKVD